MPVVDDHDVSEDGLHASWTNYAPRASSSWRVRSPTWRVSPARSTCRCAGLRIPARRHGVSPSWSVFCVDSGIAFTPNIGVDGDLRIRIDPAELRVVDDGVAWAPGSLDRPAGRPGPLCTRSLLKGVESGMRRKGLTGRRRRTRVHDAVGATPATRPPIRGRRTACAPRWTGRRSWSTSRSAAERAGLPVEQIHTEYGHDQLEVSLAPTTPSPPSTRSFAARIVIGRAAARHGLRISFSPVPFDGEAGNGAHLHLSLADAEGRCYPAETGPTACGRRAVRDRRGARRRCRTCSASMRVRCCRRRG